MDGKWRNLTLLMLAELLAMSLWFSASDAETVREFNSLTGPARVDQLADEGGFSVVATHFGKGFVRDGKVDSVTRRNLEHLASLDGWFPTTGELLDHLRARSSDRILPSDEWRMMQLRFAWDLGKSRFLRKFGVHP